MPLPSFTITGTVFDLLGNTAGGDIVGNGLGGATPAQVRFISNVPTDQFVRWDGDGAIYRVDEVVATVNGDGSITRNGDPVMLLANDSGLSVDGLQWEVRAGSTKRFWFNAPTDGDSVDLGSVAPVPGVSVVGLPSLPWGDITGKPAAFLAGPNVANGYPVLDGAAKILAAQLPDLALIQFKGSKANQAAMLATTGELGDWVIRTDTSTGWIITGSDPTMLSSWTQLPYPPVTWTTVLALLTANAAAARTAIVAAPSLTTVAAITTATTPAMGVITPYNATSGALSVPLPALSGFSAGDTLGVQKAPVDVSGNTVTFTRAASDTFDSGSTSLTLRGFGELQLLQVVVISGTKYWKVISGNNPLLKGRFVQPEEFGAVGDGTTDDGPALVRMFQTYAAANGGASIHLPAGRTYATSLALLVQSNTVVLGRGEIKCLQNAPGGRGAVVLIVNGIHDVWWDGPSVDGNFTTNANPIAIGTGIGAASSDPFNRNIYINAVVKRARVDKTIQASTDLVFGGGGKGFTVQFHTENMYARIVAEDCDVSASIEMDPTGTSSVPDKTVRTNVLDLISYDAHRTHFLVAGGTPSGLGSGVSAGYAHSLHPGVKVNLYASGGMDSPIVNLTTDVEGPNYEQMGVITSGAGCGVDIDFYAAVQERATLIRGKLFASKIKGRALMDNLQDVWDATLIAGQGGVYTFASDNEIDVKVHATTHSGELLRFDANNAVRRSEIAISTWIENGVGAIINAADARQFGPSVAYRFRDMKSSPIKEIVGMSAIAPLPTWALAGSGGRVAAQRESWPYIGYNEAPLILGSAGTDRRQLHWDNTSTVLRSTAAAPSSEADGAAFALQNFVASEADRAATPTALGKSLLRTANTGATTITNLTNGYTGQVVTILFADANTTVANNSTIKLRGGVSRAFANPSTLTLTSLSSVWYEIGSSDTFLTRTRLTLTSAVTLGSTGDYIVLIDASGAPTLPTAVANIGLYTFKNIHSANRTISTTSSQTISGSTTYTLLPSQSIDVVSDGSNWRIV